MGNAISLKIEHDVAEAMKAKRELELSTLRLIRAAIKNALIELRGKDADEDVIAVSVLKRQVKQTQDAIQDFLKGGRADLVATAEKEIALLQSYLPQELSDEEITKIVAEAIAAAGPNPHAGKLIGDVMKRIAGRADGARARTIVEATLKASA